MKYDQDKAFGVDNLRQAFNQVKVLYENNFGDNGKFECVGLDVKAMRSQPASDCYAHIEKVEEGLRNTARKGQAVFDYKFQQECVKTQNFERLEMYVMELLMHD